MLLSIFLIRSVQEHADLNDYLKGAFRNLTNTICFKSHRMNAFSYSYILHIELQPFTI